MSDTTREQPSEAKVKALRERLETLHEKAAEAAGDVAMFRALGDVEQAADADGELDSIGEQIECVSRELAKILGIPVRDV